jgi:hypothetical protein
MFHGRDGRIALVMSFVDPDLGYLQRMAPNAVGDAKIYDCLQKIEIAVLASRKSGPHVAADSDLIA